MRFPGSKLLSKDLATQTASFDNIIRNCEEVNLSGYMEVTFGDAEGLILFYLGEQINVIYRAGNEIFVSNEATMKLRNTSQTHKGKVSIYELPLDMAHMLRGLSNRQEIFGQIFAVEPLKDLIAQLEKAGHTGSLEVITNKGNGMILLVRGRISSGYFETEAGNTFEKGEALNKIFEILEKSETSARVFKSEFSQDIWRSRHETRRARKSRLHDILEQQRHQETDSTAPATSGPQSATAKPTPIIKDSTPLQRKILTEIRQQTPSILAAFFFNMETEEIEVDLVEAPSETENRFVIEKLPAFVKYLENLTAMKNDDHIETLTMGSENFYLMVKCIPETGEGLALITDKSQPATLASALLLNASNRYVLMMSGVMA